jgi:hypothetical protein
MLLATLVVALLLPAAFSLMKMKTNPKNNSTIRLGLHPPNAADEADSKIGGQLGDIIPFEFELAN